MNFCATCGRERTGDARFCGGCGTELQAAGRPPPERRRTLPTIPAGGDRRAPRRDRAGAEPRRGTRRRGHPRGTAPGDWDARGCHPGGAATGRHHDRPAGRRRVARAATPAAAEPDPFAAWFAAGPAEGKRHRAPSPAGQWQAARAVAGGRHGVRRDRASGPGLPAPAARPRLPAAPAALRRAAGAAPGRPARSSGGRKAAFIIVVVLVMLAAGGGAYALVSRSNQHNTAQPPARPHRRVLRHGHARGRRRAPAPRRARAPAASAPASASASPGVVSLGPGVASNPAEPAVETTLSRYFQGINTHNYAEYASALDPQRAGDSARIGVQLRLLVHLRLGDDADLADQHRQRRPESATVTFTSHQAAGTGRRRQRLQQLDSSTSTWSRRAAATSSAPPRPATSPSTRTASPWSCRSPPGGSRPRSAHCSCSLAGRA